ncbi:MAG: cation:proton antiporter, partial [Acidobacteriota bacterium]|nr:cation:proton antiporter [Acidobacteriota bacterium]
GLILFSIGTVFEFGHFRGVGRQLIRITLVESATAAILVTAALGAIGQPWPVALVLGGLAIETAAASTLMVLRECNAQGKVTDALVGVFALDNLLCLVTVNAIVTGIEFSHSGESLLTALYQIVLPFVWQVAGGVALGYMVGFLLALWSAKVVEHGEQLILLAGCVLFCVGVSNVLHISPLVTNLAVGATLVNLSERSRHFLTSLSKTDPPLYAIFFVLSGADLNLSLLPALGLPGLVYIAARLAGKVTGTRAGTYLAKVDRTIQNALPFGMCAQAGLAIGLTLTIKRRIPNLAPAITTVVLAAVIVFEIVGPLAVRWMVIRSGEAHPESDAPMF